MLDRKLLKTLAGRAAVAKAWHDDGSTMDQLAKVFGYKTVSPIRNAVDVFVREFDPRGRTHRPPLDGFDSSEWERVWPRIDYSRFYRVPIAVYNYERYREAGEV